MTQERNEPCPCGSGIKYKKCHGAAGGGTSDAIERNRRSAYQGERGQQREAFCLKYTLHKTSQLENISAGLHAAVKAEGKTVTCDKGCSSCCRFYVVATLQECEAIVYYLYHHEPALQNFLMNYASWKDAVAAIDGAYKEIGRLRAKRWAKEFSDEDRAAFEAALNGYAGAAIRCPFLADGSCSVYEVRPYVCAGLVSITPRDWCLPGHEFNDKAELIRRETIFTDDMPYLDNQYSKVILANLPVLVNAILNRGWDYLRGVPGFI